MQDVDFSRGPDDRETWPYHTHKKGVGYLCGGVESHSHETDLRASVETKNWTCQPQLDRPRY